MHRRTTDSRPSPFLPCYSLLYPIFSGTDLRVVLDLLSFPTVCLNIGPAMGFANQGGSSLITGLTVIRSGEFPIDTGGLPCRKPAAERPAIFASLRPSSNTRR